MYYRELGVRLARILRPIRCPIDFRLSRLSTCTFLARLLSYWYDTYISLAGTNSSPNMNPRDIAAAILTALAIGLLFIGLAIIGF